MHTDGALSPEGTSEEPVAFSLGAFWKRERVAGIVVLASVGAAVAFRLLYLARFGWDPGWMNLFYLQRAKEVWLHGWTALGPQPPFTPIALVLLHSVGLSPLHALQGLYLGAHLVLAQGILAQARAVWPESSARRLLLLGALVACVPLLSTIAGYRNVGALAGAALFASALGNALLSARSGGASRLVVAAALAALGCTARFEALAGSLAAVAALSLPGRWRKEFPMARTASLALLLAACAGIALLFFSRTPAPDKQQASYGFYTFYDGLPWLLWNDKTHDSEYARYRDSASLFGTAAENADSIPAAMVRHPGPALLRFALKPLDWIAALGWIGSLTPLGLVLAVLGARKWRGRSAARLVPLLAYLGPAAILFVPVSAPHYFVAIVAPLLVAAATGAEGMLAHVRWSASRIWATHAMLATAALIGIFGKADVMNSPVLNEAAEYLRSRCAAGCVTNLLPQAIRNQAWVDLDGPLPPLRLANNDERKILGGGDALVPFIDRVHAAREAAWSRPVLYVDMKVASFAAWEPTFERASSERPPDVSDLVEERRFESGLDRIVVYALRDGAR